MPRVRPFLRTKRKAEINNVTQREAERLRNQLQLFPAAIKTDNGIVANAESASLPSHNHPASDISDFDDSVKAITFTDVRLLEKSADPSNPSEGNAVIWMSDGTGTGDDGDIMIKVTAGGSTKTATLIDFSAV